jgi:pilus assembly protein Flp/PilA
MLSKFTKRLSDDTSGATAIEYGLIVALIAIAIITSVSAFAGEANEMWTGLDSDVTAAIGNGPNTPPPD